MSSFYYRCISSLAFTLLVGCAAAKRMSDELPSTFLEGSDLKSKVERLPFDHTWLNPGTDWPKYNKVLIKPVRADLLPADTWKASRSVAISNKEEFHQEVNKLAEYFHQQLIEQIKKREGKYMANLASKAEAGVAVVEIVFTELEFSHPLEKAAALAIPLPGTGLVSSAVSDPHITFALRVTDGSTAKLLATAADRKYAPSRILNLDKFLAASANREICQLWAEEIADTFGSDKLTKVSEKKWSLIPW